VERFVNGPMYHIDGLILNGNMKICWPSRYVNTVMEFATNGFIAGYSLNVSDPLIPRLQSYIQKCLKALEGPPSYTFHAEAWHTPEDDVCLLQSARTLCCDNCMIYYVM
jgi:hypothetical protein